MLKMSPRCLAAVLLLQMPITFAQAASVAAADPDPAMAGRIDAVVAPFFKAGDPGATLLVIKDGKTLLRKSYGMADVERGIPLQPAMAMRLGSITKQFTSTAILMLAEEGKLSVTDPITKFLPDYPATGKKITIEHLLTHTSGIPNYTSKLIFSLFSSREKSVAEMIDSFKSEPLEFEPGTRHAYSNSGYFILGAIIEKVSGLPYANFVQQRIFTPLGMTQTAYETPNTAPGTRAVGHTAKMWGGAGPAPAISMSQVNSAGAILSTVDDMAKWEAAISSGKLLKPASWAQAFTPYKLSDGKSTNYGYGWQMAKVRGANEISHGGDVNGFAVFALRVPEKKVYVVLLTNTDSDVDRARPSVVAKKAAAVAIGNPYPDFRPVALDASTLAAYAGDYKLSEQVSRTVRRDHDHLEVLRSGRPTLAVYPLGGDRFSNKNIVTVYRFDRNATGAIARLVVDDDGIEQVHSRMK